MGGEGALQVCGRLTGPAEGCREHAQMVCDRPPEGDRGTGHHGLVGERQQGLVQVLGSRAHAQPRGQLRGKGGTEQELVIARQRR